MKGYVNSIQSLGTVDGPGIRFVIFFQGCNLRCGCCHNPETWKEREGKLYSHIELVSKAERYREYFKDDGGITLSGGEPLIQAEFAKEILKEAKKRNINTCLDTSGSILNENVKELLLYTDRVLLDIKYTNDEMYKKYVGCSIKKPLEFLSYLNENKIPTTIRQVIIPGLNDEEKNIKNLKKIIKEHPCVDKTELLPFKKLCKVKYDNLNLDFEFENFKETPKEKVNELYDLLAE